MRYETFIVARKCESDYNQGTIHTYSVISNIQCLIALNVCEK